MSEYITTYTGLHFRPTEPDSDLIRIQDIAHALSLICRGNGACADILVCGRALYLLCKRGSSERIFRAYDTCMSAP